jgi:hypothetical protein
LPTRAAFAIEPEAFPGSRLASFEQSHQVEFKTDLPKTGTEKLQCFRLRERREARDID